MNKPSHHSITGSGALLRGLTLLRSVSTASEPVRFSDMRNLLTGVPDSTLSRIIQQLETAGYFARDPAGGYRPGPELQRWMDALHSAPASISELFRRTVSDLVRSTHESAAVAMLEDGRFMVAESQTPVGAVSVIPAGGLLRYESDHAASLALLSSLSLKERIPLIESPFSRIANRSQFELGCSDARRWQDVFLDQSMERPGVSRMAAAIQAGKHRGAVFLCMTTERAIRDFEALARQVTLSRDTLLEQLRSL